MLSQLLPKLCASDPSPPEVLKASYSVPSISISSMPSSGRTSTVRPSTMASQGLPYSLMSPSVDQVSEYFSTLCGCCGNAPTRSRTLRRVSKCRISSPPAMLMKPGARPHCGTNAACAPRARLLTRRVTSTSSVRSK